MAQEIQRWEMFDHIEHGALMRMHNKGYYVLYADHLAALSEQSRKHREEMEGMLREIRREFATYGPEVAFDDVLEIFAAHGIRASLPRSEREEVK